MKFYLAITCFTMMVLKCADETGKKKSDAIGGTDGIFSCSSECNWHQLEWII